MSNNNKTSCRCNDAAPRKGCNCAPEAAVASCPCGATCQCAQPCACQAGCGCATK